MSTDRRNQQRPIIHPSPFRPKLMAVCVSVAFSHKLTPGTRLRISPNQNGLAWDVRVTR